MADSPKRYIPSYKRSAEPPPMRLTARDRNIILAVYRYRLLSAHQVEALLFRSEKPHGKRTVCQRRLQLLYHHGFLERLPSPIFLGEGRQPYVYALARRGADLLATELDRDRADIGWQPKYNQVGISFVQHTLAINDVRLVLTLLAEDGRWQLTQWLDESDFRTAEFQDKVPYRVQGARMTRIFPDGYFTLQLPHLKQEAHFFLEVDQGTMSNKLWQDKMKAYYQFRQNGLSEQLYGTRNFRLLAVVNSRQRLTNLKRATERVGGDRYYWFTTQATFDIWQPETLLTAPWAIAAQEAEHPLFD